MCAYAVEVSLLLPFNRPFCPAFKKRFKRIRNFICLSAGNRASCKIPRLKLLFMGPFIPRLEVIFMGPWAGAPLSMPVNTIKPHYFRYVAL